MRQYRIRLAALLIALLLASFVSAEVKVITATADLAFFAERIGGEKVSAESIAHPQADVHYVEVRPSYMIKVKRADLVLRVGLELDIWMDQIIAGSRAGDLTIIDCSKYIHPLEVPKGKIDASQGDIHGSGNPHYWTSPENVRPITDAIVEGLVRVDPANAELYRQRQTDYLTELETGLKGLSGLIESLNGVKIVTYHNSWPYFNQYVNLEAAGFVEPFPGVPPSPSHIRELIQLIKEDGIKLIGVEPYFDRRVPDRIAERTGCKVVTLYPTVGGRKEGESYLDWLRGNLETVVEGAK